MRNWIAKSAIGVVSVTHHFLGSSRFYWNEQLEPNQIIHLKAKYNVMKSDDICNQYASNQEQQQITNAINLKLMPLSPTLRNGRYKSNFVDHDISIGTTIL